MKKLNLDTKITVCSYEELSPEEKILIDRAKEAKMPHILRDYAQNA